jgi:hypothetical protein
MGNLDLWDKVCETNPNFTKKVNQRGGFTSVCPQYQIKEATKQFGCYGKGWGFESIDFDYQFVSDTGLVIVNAIFFYVLGGERSSFPINNAWPMKSGVGDKARVDPDFAKKAETNTMSKALSKLGFSADVFMGQFDDAEYVNMMDAKARVESGDDEKIRQENDKFNEWAKKEIESLSLAPNANAVQLMVNRIEPKMMDKLTIIKATNEKRAVMKSRLYAAADKAIENLNNKG